MRDSEARAIDRIVRRLSDIEVSLCEAHDIIKQGHKAQKHQFFSLFIVILSCVILWLGLVLYLILHRW